MTVNLCSWSGRISSINSASLKVYGTVIFSPCEVFVECAPSVSVALAESSSAEAEHLISWLLQCYHIIVPYHVMHMKIW